jgi:hypothetical protein
VHEGIPDREALRNEAAIARPYMIPEFDFGGRHMESKLFAPSGLKPCLAESHNGRTASSGANLVISWPYVRHYPSSVLFVIVLG